MPLFVFVFPFTTIAEHHSVLHAYHSPYYSLSHHSQWKADSHSRQSQAEEVSCECVSWCSVRVDTEDIILTSPDVCVYR